MSLTAFNRIRRIKEEKDKVDAIEKENQVEEKIEVAVVEEQPEEVVEEKKNTRRRNKTAE